MHAWIQEISAGRVLTAFFSNQRISQRTVGTSLKDIWAQGVIAPFPVVSRGGSIPEFLRKSIVTCNLLCGGSQARPPVPTQDLPIQCPLLRTMPLNAGEKIFKSRR